MKTVPLSITKVIFPLQLVSRQQLVANVKSVFLRESSRGTDFNFRQHIYHNSTLRYVCTCTQLRKSVGSEQAIFGVSLVSMDEACKWKGWGGIRSRCKESSLCLQRRSTVGTGRKTKICYSQRPSTAALNIREGGRLKPTLLRVTLTDRPWPYDYATERPRWNLFII